MGTGEERCGPGGTEAMRPGWDGARGCVACCIHVLCIERSSECCG